MGNYFGIDMISSVDNTISNMVYNPPKFNKLKFSHILNNPRVNSFDIQSRHITTNVLEISPKFKSTKILIFSHGNACDNISMYTYLKSLSEGLGIAVCSYDYPQYGMSTGELNENTCTESLTSVVNYYLGLHYDITLVAQSIGTGVLVNYATNNNWTNPIILISPYMSVPSIATGTTLMDSCITKNRYSITTKIDKLKCKVKIFHGVDDTLINISHSKHLYEQLPNKALKPVWIQSGTHNNILEKITLTDYIYVLNDAK